MTEEAKKNEGRSLIIIPTYNERENVVKMHDALRSLYPSIGLLFIDDNSPDGTGAVVDELCSKDHLTHAIHREGKLGLGTAYIAGFRWALERDYEFVFEMDCDFSHDPSYVADFLHVASHADLVLGSRYTSGISVINWPLRRVLLSVFATMYVKIITGLPANDATGGFKCFRRKVLEAIDMDNIRSNGYSFQIELTYYAWLKGFKIREVPIIFYERSNGISKMNKKIVYEAVFMVWRLLFAHLFEKKPQKQSFYEPELLPKKEI